MLFSCNKENDTLRKNVDNNLTEKQVIDELNLLVHHFKNVSYKVTPSNQLDLYKPNQEQNTIIEQLKESPNYALYLDAMQIIESIEPMRISWGCGFSLAGNFVATLSLGGCVTGVGCPLAIAGKAIAMASIAASC